MTTAVSQKESALRTLLASFASVVVGYSGGVDSTFLVAVAHEVLGDRMLAVTTQSETNTSLEWDQLQAFVSARGIPHRVVKTSELAIPGYAENPTNRCYLCKGELYRVLTEIATQEGYGMVVDGANVDDVEDYRPGRQAAHALQVRSPLLEVGFTKEGIREALRARGIAISEQPSSPCLSSRIPYGETITQEKLNQVRAGEDFLRTRGFTQLRVRHHGETVRLELSEDALPRVLAVREEVVSFFKSLGFTYVALDLEGFRSGRLNDVLPSSVRARYTGLDRRVSNKS